jgi:3D (Asp-Asp-Asp) domain-containing protein
MVAVLNRSIPMYAKAHVWGQIQGTEAQRLFGDYYDRTFTVTDHIGHGSDVDIYMTSCARGLSWGRQHLHVTFN